MTTIFEVAGYLLSKGQDTMAKEAAELAGTCEDGSCPCCGVWLRDGGFSHEDGCTTAALFAALDALAGTPPQATEASDA